MLTVSTFKEIFSGNRELFKGTFIYDSDYTWKEYPVTQFDFSKCDADKSVDELNQILESNIDTTASKYSVVLSESIVTQKFDEILRKLSEIGQVVVLIDEYVKFAFLTGVTKFSQVSIFYGLNNLTDITIYEVKL